MKYPMKKWQMHSLDEEKNNVKLLVKMGYKLIYYLFNGNKIPYK